MGLNFHSCCSFFLRDMESLDNLFLRFDYAKGMCNSIDSVFNIEMDFSVSLHHFTNKVLATQRSSQISNLLHTVVAGCLLAIWYARN